MGGERGDICMKAVGNSWAVHFIHECLYVILGHNYKVYSFIHSLVTYFLFYFIFLVCQEKGEWVESVVIYA